MGPERAARSRPRGGADIPPFRAPRVRLIAGALSFAIAGAVAWGVARLSLDLLSPGLTLITAGLALSAWLALGMGVVLALLGWVGTALGFLAGLLVLNLLLPGTSKLGEAGLGGVALLAAGELAQWSIDARHPGRYDLRVHRARAAAIMGLVLRGLGVVLIAGIAAALPVSGGIELMVVATGAAVGVFGLIALADRAR